MIFFVTRQHYIRYPLILVWWYYMIKTCTETLEVKQRMEKYTYNIPSSNKSWCSSLRDFIFWIKKKQHCKADPSSIDIFCSCCGNTFLPRAFIWNPIRIFCPENYASLVQILDGIKIYRRCCSHMNSKCSYHWWALPIKKPWWVECKKQISINAMSSM